jgi:hypothetical protein
LTARTDCERNFTRDDFNFLLWTFHLYVITFHQHLHMEHINNSVDTMLTYEMSFFVLTISIFDGCHNWNRNCWPFRRSWIYLRLFVGLCCLIFSFLCSLLWTIVSLFVLFLWALYCLSFCNLWLLITPVVS